jgi:hypothetical protein
MGCQVRKFDFTQLFLGDEYNPLIELPIDVGNITWSVSPGLQIVSGQGSLTVSVKEDQPDPNADLSISVSFTYEGSTFTQSKSVIVEPLNISGLSLHLVSSWMEGDTICSLLHVRNESGNEIAGSDLYFTWATSKGCIYSCEGEVLSCDINPGTEIDFDSSTVNGNPGLGFPPDFPPDDTPPPIPVGNPCYVILRFTPILWSGGWYNNVANVSCSYQACSNVTLSGTLTVQGWHTTYSLETDLSNTAPHNAKSYTIYPNPASSTLHFELNSSTQQNNTQSQQGNCRVQMYSIMSGTLVLDQKVANFTDNFNINVNNVPDGMYLLILLQGNEVVQQQTILIQH